MTKMNFYREHYVLVAKVTKPHGIKGEIKVYPFSCKPDNFKLYSNLVFVDPTQGNTREINLSSSRSQGKIAVLSLSGITTRNDAENLVGCEVWASKEDLPDLADDEYYWGDFEGMDVHTQKGLDLGHVSGLISTGAHDILIIAGHGEEYMIPVRDEFIVEVDEADGKIIVDLPEGLLEINKKRK